MMRTLSPFNFPAGSPAKPPNQNAMANSKKADAGAAKLAAADKAKDKKPKADKKNNPAEPEHPPVTENTQVAYKFTPDELSHMNAQLRGKLGEIEALQDQKKAAMKDFALRIQNAENDMKLLLNKLNTGEETRAMEVLVEFDTKSHRKTYHHPVTGEVVGEAPMQPADWQLPMFKPAPDGTGETIAPKGSTDVPPKPGEAPKGKKGKKDAEPGANAGTTPVGDALDKAAGSTQPQMLVIDLTKDYESPAAFLKAYRAAAKSSDWNEAQISVIGQQLKLAETVEKMIETLRPHTKAPTPPPEKEPFE
jgi:hypothetical protein